MNPETIEPIKIDRTGWPPGPWDNEPDRVDFEHVGFPCLILRNRSGHLCGYVGVPPEHPLHGVGYGEESEVLKVALDKRLNRPVGEQPGMSVMLAMLSGDTKPTPDLVLEVHGGITYSAKCGGNICHVPRKGQPADVFWFGFDCAHCDDASPGRASYYGGAYRTVEYVRRECERLAEQLREIGS